jgi:hypothetical protein
MTTAEFKEMVTQLQNPLPRTEKDRLYYAAGGLVSDAGEVLDAMKDYYWYGKTSVEEFELCMAEECSDVLHWLQAVCNVFGWTIEDILRVNRAKLGVRYPEGFTKKAATFRDKPAEREAMHDALYQE